MKCHIWYCLTLAADQNSLWLVLAMYTHTRAHVRATIADSDLVSLGWVPGISGVRKHTGDHETPTELSKVALVYVGSKTW